MGLFMQRNSLLRCLSIVTLVFIFSGCATYETTRKPENLTTYHLNKNYLEAYRVMNETLLTECHSAIQSLTTSVFPDIETARITSSQSNVVAYSIDFVKSTKGGADMNVYSPHSNFRWIALNMQKAINEDIKTCYWKMGKQ